MTQTVTAVLLAALLAACSQMGAASSNTSSSDYGAPNRITASRPAYCTANDPRAECQTAQTTGQLPTGSVEGTAEENAVPGN